MFWILELQRAVFLDVIPAGIQLPVQKDVIPAGIKLPIEKPKRR